MLKEEKKYNSLLNREEIGNFKRGAIENPNKGARHSREGTVYDCEAVERERERGWMDR